ncbi:HEAT repeat domain-containing protein [Planktothrix paucivesiculata]|uniref:Heat domain-containing protein n=1 Tax=Planktothrix paucivesiculata PCC 9631 TaxID=671071 RepID=A0A7Z9BVH6_9CYAN|nr:HEAT repeat domain-containing protein [Planktothrix paucivesiculata]VXD21889.1 Heat domain-containing protein [Planktothrix paucivesiculata PCC 9631]
MEDEKLSRINTKDPLESPLDQLDDGEMAQPDPEEMLLLLTSPESQQRMIAARAFCEIRDERAIPDLIRLLEDSCPLVRVSVAYALGRNSNSQSVEALMAQLHQDWNGYVRKGVVWALGTCGDRRALEPLLDALKTDIPAVRLWAASSLGQMAKVSYDAVIRAIPPMIEAMRQDSVPAVRSNCAWALGQLCRELPSNVVYAVAIDALIEALEEDEDVGVKDDAKSSLLRVGDPRGLQIIEDLEMDGLL